MIGEVLSGVLIAVLVSNIIIDYRKIKKEDDNHNKLIKLEQDLKSLSLSCLTTVRTVEACALSLQALGEKVNELRNGEQPTSVGEPLQK